MLSAMIRYHDDVNADSRIVTSVSRALDFMWTNEWHAPSKGFLYVTHKVFILNNKPTTDPSGTLYENPDPQPGLNGLIAPAFAWQYARTGSASDRGRVDQILEGLYSTRSWYAVNGKAFDQAYTGFFNVLAWRDR